jgi:hypothetical protein
MMPIMLVLTMILSLFNGQTSNKNEYNIAGGGIKRFQRVSAEPD